MSEPNVVLPSAETFRIHAVATRRYGLSVALQISADELPPGVTIDPVTVPATSGHRTHLDLTAHVTPGTDVSDPWTARVTVTADGQPPASAPLRFVHAGFAGTLDASFGDAGIQIIDLPFKGFLASVRPVGSKFLMLLGRRNPPAWEYWLARVNADGSLDTDFDGDGLLQLPSDCVNDDFESLPDGRVLIPGSSASDGTSEVVLCRLLQDGRFDPNFGTNGRVRFPDLSAPRAMVVDGDDVWIAGLGIYLLHVSIDGVVRSRSVSAPSAGDNFLQDLVRLPDGSLIGTGMDDSRGALWHWNADGNLDMSFGGTGFVLSDPFCDIQSVELDPDGDLIALGESYCGEGGLVVARFHPDGAVDGTFGTGGYIVRGGEDRQVPFDVDFSSGRMLVAAGLKFPEHGSSIDMAALRFTNDGALDGSFGWNGVFRKYIASMEVCADWDEELRFVQPRADGTALGIAQVGGVPAVIRFWL